jgi:uncharacterized protein YbjT (DUF2867 family)
MVKLQVFVAGATGYLGRPLIEALLARGHSVTALTRAGSAGRVPAGAFRLTGDALDAATYAARMPTGAIFVHLVGVAHPSPRKAREFQSIDLASVRASLAAARQAGAARFVYVSVAHPAPVMKAYIAARTAAEELIRASGLPATFLRPWYVLGPGHRWAYALLPLYWVLERVPSTRPTALRLGLVRRAEMIAALVDAVEQPSTGVRMVEVPEIKGMSNRTRASHPSS